MSSLYLNSNLNGLITELTKYVSIPEIMKFLSALDFVMNDITKPYYLTSLKKTLLNKLMYINAFLFKTYVWKCGEEYQYKEINLEEYCNRVIDFKNKLVIELRTKNRDFWFDDAYRLNSILNQTIKAQSLEYDLKELNYLKRKLN